MVGSVRMVRDRLVAGLRPVDAVIAGALTLVGVVLMVENISFTDAQVARALADGSLLHSMSSHSWWMLPVWCLATVPLLWWRRGLIPVTVVVIAVVVVHDLLFGWVTRCGSGLPLAFVLAYLGAVSFDRRRALVMLGLSSVLVLAVLVVDASAWFGGAIVGLPVLAIVWAVGRAVRHRMAMAAELRARTAELQELRDRRSAMQVADEQARLSRQLEELLQQRLAVLTAAAETGRALEPADARVLFDRIETDSRATLDDMRRIVGLLRGEDAALAPVPTVAHLDALLARHRPGPRLTVTGDARGLPATVELSAYRIVEHLVGLLAETGDVDSAVTVHFDEAALEIRVSGPVARTGDVRAATGRARERAALLGGSLDVRVSRGRATATALLPVG